MGDAGADGPAVRRAWRHAVSSLHQAVRTLRQRPVHPRLRQAALRQCSDAVAAATAHGPLRLQIDAGAVSCAGEELLRFPAGDAPFGALAAAGIGELHLPTALPAAVLARLLHVLASAAIGADAENDVAAALRAADLPGVLVRAATSSDAPGPDGPRAAWWMLPPPNPPAALRPLIERDGFANLPAEAARLLLADLDEPPTAAGAPGHLLLPLLDAVLARGDGASAAWLLERACGHAAVPPPLAHDLRQRAHDALHGAWLTTWLEHQDRVPGLVALAMQLGDPAVHHLAAAADAAGQPLPAWVRDFLTA